MRGYAEIEQIVNRWGIQMRATRQRNLVLLVYGILHSRSGSLSAIVRHWPYGARRHTHRLKRLHRFLKNPGVQVERCFQVLAAVIWPYRPGGGRTPLYPVILDWTKVHDLSVLFAAVPRKKRALPLAYGVYHPQRLRKSQNQLERGMLTLVASLLPQSARLVVLADAGFGQTELIRWLQERGIDYVIRLRAETLVHYRGKTMPVGSLDTLEDAPILFSQVDYRDQNPVRLNLVVSRKGDKTWYLGTSFSDAEQAVNWYKKRFWIEIVFTQMTKMDVFARRTGRDHVSDLNISIFDNHPVNEQFYQFPFLFKVSILQPDLDTAAEILNRGCQAGELVLPIYLMDQLLFQVFHALTLALQISSSALVLRQRDDTVQVSFGESIQLGLKSDLSTTQIFATRLQLLREPVAPLRSLQSNCDDFRMLQDLTQIVPDQLIQLVGRDVSSKTTLVKMDVNHIRLSSTYIVCIARMQLARCATEVASTTAHQTPQ